MRKFYYFVLLWLIASALPASILAETFHLINGQTVTGELVSMDEKGIILKQDDGTYADRLPWAKLSQENLKELQQNPKAAQFVEPFIEVSQQDKVKRKEFEIKEVPRLPRPDSHSLIAALFTSTMGLFIVLMLYAGNLYAAYEISIFRAQPTGLVCGVSAVAPVVGPIIFLSMPTRIKHKEQPAHLQAEEYVEPSLAAAIAADQAAAAAHEPAPAAPQAAAQPAAVNLPPAKVYARGQYTFNRRFLETQMHAYFAMTRPESEKDNVMTLKAARGTFVVQRFSRITATDIHLQIDKGNASEEVIVPFVEIQEITIKHKDA